MLNTPRKRYSCGLNPPQKRAVLHNLIVHRNTHSLQAMGDLSYTSVPQNTHPDLIPTPGCIAICSRLQRHRLCSVYNCSHDRDGDVYEFTNNTGRLCIPGEQSTCLDAWTFDSPWCDAECSRFLNAGTMYAPFLHLPRSFVFIRCDPKLSSMRLGVPWSPSHRRLAALIGRGSLPLPPSRRLQHHS